MSLIKDERSILKAVSKDATKLGIEVGMTGAEAIDLLRQKVNYQ